MGSYYLQAWHMRWFNDHLPNGAVQVINLSTDWTGLAICGPDSRAVVQNLVEKDISNESFRFLDVQRLDIAGCSAVVARLSVAGELGYEINVPKSAQRALYQGLTQAGSEIRLEAFWIPGYEQPADGKRIRCLVKRVYLRV